MSAYQKNNMDYEGEQCFLNIQAKVPSSVLGMDLEPLMTDRDVYDFESLIFQTVVNEGKHLSVCSINFILLFYAIFNISSCPLLSLYSF